MAARGCANIHRSRDEVQFRGQPWCMARMHGLDSELPTQRGHAAWFHTQSSSEQKVLNKQYDDFTDTNITWSRFCLVIGSFGASIGIMHCSRTQMRCVHSVPFGRRIGARVPPSVVSRCKVVASALEEIDPNTGMPFDNASTRTVKPR